MRRKVNNNFKNIHPHNSYIFFENITTNKMDNDYGYDFSFNGSWQKYPGSIDLIVDLLNSPEINSKKIGSIITIYMSIGHLENIYKLVFTKGLKGSNGRSWYFQNLDQCFQRDYLTIENLQKNFSKKRVSELQKNGYLVYITKKFF